MNLSAISQSAPTITRRSFIGIACIAGISLAFDSISAYAAPTWGTSLKKTVGGITYTYASGYELGANPQAYVRINASKSVAAKTMQACAYVIKESNLNIVASSGWAKNAGGTSSLQTRVASSSLKLGLRSCGKVIIAGASGQLWCNPIKPRSLPPELAVNENGQTLGTYLDAERGSVPDLVGIVADSGLDGYAYWEQFDAEDCPEVIPVYTEDGTTQIGIFTFGDK